jgi:hypothetical protein
MKYSNTYYKLVAVALFALVTAILAGMEQSPTICAICSASAFVCWYVSMMLPINEKYRKGYKQNKGSIEL